MCCFWKLLSQYERWIYMKESKKRGLPVSSCMKHDRYELPLFFSFCSKIAHLLTQQIVTTNKDWNPAVHCDLWGCAWAQLTGSQPERRSGRSVGSSLSLLLGGWYRFSVTPTLPGGSLFLSTPQAGPPALHPPTHQPTVSHLLSPQVPTVCFSC